MAPPWLIGLCVSLFGYGVFLHFFLRHVQAHDAGAAS